LAHTEYRRDIDGLRALAVLCVVYFHAFPEKLAGGFIGVDIFFVISGYLITRIISNDVDSGVFSIKNFYIRRVRRIFPALLVVMLAAGVFGWFFLLKEEFKQLGKHIFAGASFISNFVLWGESGYFDNSSDTKPLLHLWSLGIEEQFYIFWPIFIWVGYKLKINLILLASVLAGISFAFNIYQIQNDIIGTFYSPITRSWELLVGGCLALVQKQYKNYYQKQYITLINIASVAGLCFLAASIFFIDKSKNFPGWIALFPVVGTTLILLSSSEAIVNRYFLSSKIMVTMGLISYPLYLWHWPILSFLRISEGTVPSANLRYKAIIVSILLAYVTYRFIERPFKFSVVFGEKIKLLILISLMFLIGFIGYFTYVNNGQIFNKKEPILNIYEGDIGHVDFNTHLFDEFFSCKPSHILEASPVWKGNYRCLQSHEDKKLDVALIGNSHAEHLFIGLAETFPEKNFVFYTKTGSPTLSNREFENIFKYVLSNQDLKKVLITVDWIGFKNLESLETDLLETVKTLIEGGKEVILTNGVPTFPFDPIRCKAVRFPQTKELCFFKRSKTHYEEMLERVALAAPKITMINTIQFFCNSSECSMVDGGKILYRDDNHLNINGSRHVGNKIRDNHLEIFN
jgi:peptidoglycan/LPS O-acetylase OafA/YrhL